MILTINIPALDHLAVVLERMAVGNHAPAASKKNETETAETAEPVGPDPAPDEKPVPKKRAPRKRSVKKDPEDKPEETPADEPEETPADGPEETPADEPEETPADKPEPTIKDVQQKCIDLANLTGSDAPRLLLVSYCDPKPGKLMNLNPKSFGKIMLELDAAIKSAEEDDVPF